MAKSYACSTSGCKRAFRNHFALTAHLRFCKKGLVKWNKGDVKCPECAQVCDSRGLGAHRTKHGIPGSSRWSLKSKKNGRKGAGKRSPTFVSTTSGITNATIEMYADGRQDKVLQALLARVQEHKEKAKEYLAKAETLAKLAEQIAEAL